MQVIGYAQAGSEFEVRDRVLASGVTAVVPRELSTVSRGKNRKPKLEQKAYLPNYVFIDCEISQYVDLAKIKGLAATKLIVPAKYHGRLQRWASGVEIEAQKVIAAHKGGTPIDPFYAGDLLRIKGGPFVEWLDGARVEFIEMVDAGRKVKYGANIGGSYRTVIADPLDVALAK